MPEGSILSVDLAIYEGILGRKIKSVVQPRSLSLTWARQPAVKIKPSRLCFIIVSLSVPAVP